MSALPAADLMPLQQFSEELRRVARFAQGPRVADPLAAAVRLITDNPSRHESRLLGRLLRALAEGTGEFRRAEISAFGSATLKVVVALMDTARDRASSASQWGDAIVAADAANDCRLP